MNLRRDRLRVLGVWLAVGLAYLIWVRATGWGIPCPIHTVTGLECPGCGITRRMDSRQRAQNRPHQFPGLAATDAAAPLDQILFQAAALQVVHGKIGSAVFFKIGMYPHDTGVAVKLGQGTGLLQKAAAAILVILVLRLGKRAHLGLARCAQGNALRQIFLNCHKTASSQVTGHIGNAESALPQRPAHQIPTRQDASARQCQRIFFPARCRVPAAVRAGPRAFRPLSEALIA